MDNQIPEDPYRILARERSHEDARQTVATNRMLVQSLVVINGGAATTALASYGAHNAPARVSPRLFYRRQSRMRLSTISNSTRIGGMRMDSGRWYAKVCPLFCVRRIAHIVLITLV